VESRRSLRLSFEYDRQEVRLIARQRVDVTRPPGVSHAIPRGQAGFWIEVRDSRGRVLYQQVLRNPIRYEIELPGPRETKRGSWFKIEHPRGAFDLLVPDLPEGRTLVLFGSAPGARAKAATELARFSLETDARAAQVRS
jgi:hypothetical protein